MRIRTIYFKVTDMERSVTFWERLLELSPNRKSEKWREFSIGEVRVWLLLNGFGDELVGSACVPVFEFDVIFLAYFCEPRQGPRGNSRSRTK
jgi:catechol 2,3-dioxygenase-like lactoylglutathione lyase family enzyme